MPSSFQKYNFEKLEVWKLGMSIVAHVYRITRNFPKSELFGLSDQLRRASTSIVLNIAEGTGQPTKKGFCVYIHRAKSSVLECVACIKIAEQEKFVEPHILTEIHTLFQEEYFKLIALAKSMQLNN